MSSKPDYISPAPSNAKERRDWDRMSFKMERYHAAVRPLVIPRRMKLIHLVLLGVVSPDVP